MDGNSRFELMSASPDTNFTGNYQSSQRGYSSPSLGRSSSFREGSESRNISSGKSNSRGSAISPGDVPSLSQCLILEPIVMGDPRHARSGELRRVLANSVGSNSEENSFGSTHLKNSPPAAVEELKRLRASVADTCVKASGRAKKFDEHLSKLNKYVEALPSKKPQQLRNELLTNERSSGATLKISQIHRNSSELGSQKFDDRSKNVGLSKRSRTSTTEPRAECRNNAVLRQPMTVTKERDILKDNNADSDMVEEKIRRLPAGGEGWDKKMRRKRSVGAVSSRSVDNDGELKRNMHNKLSMDSSLLLGDSAHGFRSGASGGGNKLEPMPSPSGSTARVTFKSEQEKSMLSRDVSGGPIKERPLGKVNVNGIYGDDNSAGFPFRLNNREENHTMSSSPIVKGKASRAPRSGSVAAANVPRVTGTLESWEQGQVVTKNTYISGPNNRKRPLPSGSSSPPITQWGGQRPQKMSRTRRTNLIPVSNNDEVQMQSEGCSPTEFGPRISIGGINASLLTKSTTNGSQNFKVKSENISSPARLSESEESGAGENRINDKGVGSRDPEERTANAGQSVGPSTIPIKKNKIVAKEDISDGVRRQGRSGRVSPFSRASTSPTREKLDNVVATKPLRNARSGSEKSGSKSGRPLKKLSDRKNFSRLGHVINGGSPDCSGESDDDREELLAAANLACSFSFKACSSAFWKTFEALFTSIGPDEKSYLSQQLKLAEESCTSLSQYLSSGSFDQDDYCREDMAASGSVSFRSNQCLNSLDRMDSVEQLQNSFVRGCSDTEKRFGRSTPLYQRVLSALIMDDESEEFEETGFGRPRNSANNSYFLSETESQRMNNLDFSEPIIGAQTRKNGTAHKIFPCNGNMDVDRSPSSVDYIWNGDLTHKDGFMHSEVEVLVRLSRFEHAPQSMLPNNSGISSLDFQYEQMGFEEKLVVELQSIGLFMEAVPALDDKEEEGIDHEIARLEKGLLEQVRKKKTCLDKIDRVIQEENDIGRDPEQVAMDKLVESGYKKLLATKGAFASKHGIPKVSKQVALAFCKRTLIRCRKFEDSGISCFSEPALREIVFAPPPQFSEMELLSGVNPAAANDTLGTSLRLFDHGVAKNGPVSNRGKKKELSLDDVGGSIFRASSGVGMSGGAKGKRSERDRDPSKNGRLSMGGAKGERKTKSKPKQKTAQLSMSGVNKIAETGSEAANSSGNRRKDVRFMSSGNAPPETSKDAKDSSVDFSTLPLDNIDGIEELGVDCDTGAPQDLNSWFNFEVDGLHEEHDDVVGLEIPMDDLSDLLIF